MPIYAGFTNEILWWLVNFGKKAYKLSQKSSRTPLGSPRVSSSPKPWLRNTVQNKLDKTWKYKIHRKLNVTRNISSFLRKKYISFTSFINFPYKHIHHIQKTEENSCLRANLRWSNRSKKNHPKFIVIGQIINSGKIDSFMCIESIIKSIHFPNIGIESIIIAMSIHFNITTVVTSF